MGQGARSIRTSSPSKNCGKKKILTKELKCSQVAKHKFWTKVLLKRAIFLVSGSKTANMATLP